jgi:hypothetical protein
MKGMGSVKSAACLVLMVLFFTDANAQVRNTMWLKTTIKHNAITDNWHIEHELHHRRQNHVGQPYPWNDHLLDAYRGWINHHQPHSDWMFSVSPLAFFQHHRFVSNNVKPYELIQPEWRFSLAAQHQIRNSSNIKPYYRPALELRYFSSTNQYVLRPRLRLGVKYELNQQFKINTFGEGLIHVKSNNIKGNQLRWQANMIWQANKNVQLEFGYLRIWEVNSIKSNNAILSIGYAI